MPLSRITDKGVSDRRDRGVSGAQAHGSCCFFLHFCKQRINGLRLKLLQQSKAAAYHFERNRGEQKTNGRSDTCIAGNDDPANAEFSGDRNSMQRGAAPKSDHGAFGDVQSLLNGMDPCRARHVLIDDFDHRLCTARRVGLQRLSYRGLKRLL